MTCDRYLEQAKSNEQAARSIENSYPDWAVTMCFYAALHWVEHYACIKGFDIGQYKEDDKESRHTCRRKYVDDLAHQLGNSNLRKAYTYLERESRKARYLQDLTSDAKMHYTKDKFTLRESFQKLLARPG
ncbi:hypothetical protein I8748_31110 [Nostoc sp. CENA67]|uniref:HEPN domain-containing protein n=1 Tax=Amazonocrinis nigriterrae CENA67 TaxID=2794033 RepID=A0A8J7LCI6_9NOST|nr:hypothetical protein [Amazonocrinis nigriterrae]MBH8566551.1 hypothetical protein [Amazonocrinis nigriterrae CENA67]